ncbi:hypothetical protein [Halorarius halobius]|uniref:hypothetical protein n=1 Tax=Halorarius halobius TaxID=2962671 RepID=UPI0020CE2151|nr:hypothetical protein [Halorarius halobius]
MTSNSHARRTVLGSIAATVAGLAGCTDRNPGPGAGDPFEEANINDESVVVKLASNTDVDRINLISPNGSSVGSKKVVSGETRVEFELGRSYTPGSYDIVGEPAGEISLQIQPNLRIQEIGVGGNHLERMPDSLGNTQDVEALVAVKNTGNGPNSITGLIFDGEIPNPTEDVKESDSKSGIYDASGGGGELDHVTVSGGEKKVLYSSTLPFSTSAEGKDCESLPDRGSLEIEIETSVGESPVSAEYTIRYSSSDPSGDCTMEIGEKQE